MDISNIIDITIILIIFFISYKFYCEVSLKKKEYEEKKNNNCNNNNNNNNIIENFTDNKIIKEKYQENIFDSSMKYIDEILKSKQNQKVNPYFMEAQFHNDYKDTLQAFNLLIPNQKQLFNRSNIPVINVSTPTNKEIFPLVTNFVKEINEVLDTNVNDVNPTRDWKTNYVEKDHKSGWEKQQEKLGLPGRLYNHSVDKEHIKLIKIDHSERFETEDEIKYTVFLIIQKPSVKDQLLIKVSYQIDKKDINLDNKNPETLVKIEEIFILGFMTKHSFGKHSVKKEYYDFGGITDSRIFSQKQVMNELNKKRKAYENECVFL